MAEHSMPSHVKDDMDDYADEYDGTQDERLGTYGTDYDARIRDSSTLNGDGHQRSASRASRVSALNQGATPSRSGTLKKRSSVKRSGSLKRSGSRRSIRPGSIRGVPTDGPEHGYDREDSVFYTPVPTKGAPTEILAERFQLWRKFLKDLIAYFREVVSSYEQRSKSLLKVSNVINNTNAPAALLCDGGLSDAHRLLRDFHKQAIVESNRARDFETDVINQLSGLRGDLAQKIKEIKSLSSDFKNSVEKEKEHTRKCVMALEEALSMVDADPSAIAGKGDPYVVKLGVERQVERQIDEENYLHRAYLNLENSGRELESIVVGEIQKAYNALASILKRDADEMYNVVEKLRAGPISMPRDREWSRFVSEDPHLVNPQIPLRRLEDIEYPGKHHPATLEVRAGMLERKSKYLKSYTAGWYVLSPTHIHEFKSADRIYTQPPVMSLYLPDQKLGSRSQPGSSSHKFVIKGRQTGSMHRGHTWVFRAETYETMLAWFDDIKNLTEKSGEERDSFVRRHASVRSASAGSARSRVSSDGGLEEDEADAIPYSANHLIANQTARDDPLDKPPRPSPGGRFPSDLMVNRNLQAPLSPSSGSSEANHDLTVAAGDLHESVPPLQLDAAAHDQLAKSSQPAQLTSSSKQQPAPSSSNAQLQPALQTQYEGQNPHNAPQPIHSSAHESVQGPEIHAKPSYLERHDSDYGIWMTPAAAEIPASASASKMHQNNLPSQQEASTRQAPLQSQEQYATSKPPRNTVFPGTATTSITDHHVGTVASDYADIVDVDDRTAPRSVAAHLTASEASTPLDSDLATSTTTSRTVNGGPVPVSLVQHAQKMNHPGTKRQNTDVSVSELYVPGEFPKVIPGDLSSALKGQRGM